MRKTTKGALAGAAAAVLLMGGFGTQAAWQAEGEAPGGEINTGHLKLDTSCLDWTLTNAVTATTKAITDASLASLLMIPGDVLSRACTFTVHIAGDNLVAADLTLTGDPKVMTDGTTPTEVTELVASGAFTTDVTSGGVTTEEPITDSVDLQDGDVVHATLSVQLKDGLSNISGQDLTGLLDSLTVTIAQKTS